MTDGQDVVLGRIETKLDRALLDLGDHERRLRALERWRFVVVGAGSTIGATIGALGTRFLPGH